MTGSDGVASATTPDVEVVGARPTRIASWLFIGNGLAWGLAFIPYAIYIRSLGRLPVIGSIEGMSGLISDRFGWQGVVWFLIPMGLLAWVEVLAGWWLHQGRREGGWLALLLLPVSMFFWIGFLLPIWILLGPVRVALVIRGWRTLR